MTNQDPYSSPNTESSVVTYAEQMTWKQKFFSFEGRMGRKDYWMSTLVIWAIFFLSILVAAGLGAINETLGMLASILVFIIYIPVIWAGFALAAKRWHDRGKSGWWSLITFVPVIGGIWFFIEVGCLPGDDGDNQYGSNPLQ